MTSKKILTVLKRFSKKMARNILCAFIALNFFVSGKNVPETKSDSAKKDSAADPDKKGGDSDSASGVIIMPSGYECRSPDPSWCHLLEKHDLNKKYAKTRLATFLYKQTFVDNQVKF